MTKDTVLFVDKKFHSGSVASELKPLIEPVEAEPVSILPDGRLNLGCPCLHSVLAHRCGHLMREAIGCFNNSTRTPRGIDCEDFFVRHAVCMDFYDKTTEK